MYKQAKYLIERIFSKKDNPLKKPSGLKLKFEHAGHKFYCYEPIQQAPSGRIELMFARLNELQKGMTREHNIQYVEATKKLFWEKKCEEGYELSTYVENIIKNPMQNTPANYLSCTMVLIDDEPTNEINSNYEDLKLDLIKKHPEIRNFFLDYTDKILKRFSDSHDSQEFWKAINHPALKENEQAFLKLITKYSSTTTG